MKNLGSVGWIGLIRNVMPTTGSWLILLLVKIGEQEKTAIVPQRDIA